jgi:hypothetical protein
MRWRLFITAILALAAQGAQLYIVSESLSDDRAWFYYRSVDVRPDGPAARRVRNASPGELVEANNPCAVKPGALQTVLKKYPTAESVFGAISFGIVAQCGSSSIVLGLPMDAKRRPGALAAGPSQTGSPMRPGLRDYRSGIRIERHLSRPHRGG